MTNINTPEFDSDRGGREGFGALRALLGKQAGAEKLGLSLWELPPGEAAYPYHFHLMDEELIIVVKGRPTLRGSAGWREVTTGEVLSFPVGERGAHQLVNWTDEPVQFLAISTSGTPDVVVYPDSGKVSAAERTPNGWRTRTRLPQSSSLDYWDGESPPRKPDAGVAASE
jgi:uncharacterized cupin superfamily protein